jgi:DeoR family fructose operon transcriptional repressor
VTVYAEERQQAIAALAAQRGRLSVSDLAVEFGVTTETVRRDLAVLERVGLLRRVHGGAVAATVLTVVEPGVAERESTRTAVKDRIAAAAVQFVPPEGGSLLLDAGTTTGRLVGMLPPDRDLVVVTNAVPAAARLTSLPGVRLLLLGGTVRGVTQAAVGAHAVQALAEIKVDVAFIGTNALSADHGLTTPDPDEAAVKRAMIASSRRTVVLADSSKLGHDQLVRFGPIDVIDTLVTDDEVDPALVAALEERGVEVVIA